MAGSSKQPHLLFNEHPKHVGEQPIQSLRLLVRWSPGDHVFRGMLARSYNRKKRGGGEGGGEERKKTKSSPTQLT